MVETLGNLAKKFLHHDVMYPPSLPDFSPFTKYLPSSRYTRHRARPVWETRTGKDRDVLVRNLGILQEPD